MQIMASSERVQELERQIRQQPMSAMDAHDLHQNIKDAEDVLEMKRNQQEASGGRISELQMQHNRLVDALAINGGCVCDDPLPHTITVAAGVYNGSTVCARRSMESYYDWLLSYRMLPACLRWTTRPTRGQM